TSAATPASSRGRSANRLTIPNDMRSLPADEAETGAPPAQRRTIQRVGVDAPLAGNDHLDGATFALEADAAFDAPAGLAPAIVAAVHTENPDVPARNRADVRTQRYPDVNAGVGLPRVIDVRLEQDAEDVAARPDEYAAAPKAAVDGHPQHVPIHR